MTERPRAQISVGIPAYNEIDSLPELHRRLTTVMDGIGADWEMVVSDNLSDDGTRDYLRGLCARDPRVRAVLLSRNFGLANAHLAVLEHTSGEWTVLMDADLQDEPEAIPQMLERAREGFDVVYAIRARRPERLPMRLATAAFYKLVGRYSSVPQPPNAGPFCVMSRRVVDAVTALSERNVFFPGLRAYVGFKQTGVPLERPPRASGTARLAFRDRIRHGLDGVFAFSNAPLRAAAWAGMVVAGFAALLEVFFVAAKLFSNSNIPFGFTSLISAVLFLGGVQLFTLGVLGQYLGRVYDETKRRPRYLVEDFVNFPQGDVGP
ncbi:MAG: polyisoprenyl-phosphate glycosyltransferase [Solirubrobacterales bacterium]|nr:polyisoprenyl-phosphate glycosyltransferase [Solirubrobacterales bacterium]